jgi:hypothetical protein
MFAGGSGVTPSDKKLCTACGEWFGRPRNMSHKEWTARVLCSLVCAREFERRPRELVLMAKPCATCGTVFDQHTDESTDHFWGRRFCTNTCTAAYASRQRLYRWPPPKRCEQCGNLFERGKTEGNPAFTNRRFCSTECVQTSRRQKHFVEAGHEYTPSSGKCGVCRAESRKKTRQAKGPVLKRKELVASAPVIPEAPRPVAADQPERRPVWRPNAPGWPATVLGRDW